jgi:serine/threonine-protein phosphatase PGAM5
MSEHLYRRLLLVRHGQYDAKTINGVTDGNLTEIGQAQAEHTAQFLKSLPVTAIRHSTLIRATETAQIIVASLPNVPMTASKHLCECVPAKPKAAEPLTEQWQEWLARQKLAPSDYRQQAAQAQHAYKMLFSSTEPGLEVVVSSGNLIGYLIARAFGAPASHWIRTRVNLCSISKVFVTSNRSSVPLVESIGDMSHLPKELQLYH